MDQAHRAAALVTEQPVTFGEHTYQARRGPDHEDSPRWTVFRDDEFITPIGFIQGHLCPLLDGEPRLFVYDTGNQPLFASKPDADDGCLPTYHNCLLAFQVPGPHPSTLSAYRRTAGGYELRRRQQ